MKKKIKILFFLAIALFNINHFQAQNLENNDDLLTANEFNFPPLQVVIDSVIKRNQMVNFRKNHIGVMESTLASERLYFTKNIGIQGAYTYGNINNLSTNSESDVNSSILSTSQQFNYSAGFYIKFPLFDFLNRKQQLKLAKLEIEEAKSMAEYNKDEIRLVVIKLYHDLILKQKLLLIKSKSMSNGNVNLEMVEKEFRNGIVPISEYVRIISITSTLESDYETTKSEFITAKQILEDMCGFSFSLKN